MIKFDELTKFIREENLNSLINKQTLQTFHNQFEIYLDNSRRPELGENPSLEAIQEFIRDKWKDLTDNGKNNSQVIYEFFFIFKKRNLDDPPSIPRFTHSIKANRFIEKEPTEIYQEIKDSIFQQIKDSYSYLNEY